MQLVFAVTLISGLKKNKVHNCVVVVFFFFNIICTPPAA